MGQPFGCPMATSRSHCKNLWHQRKVFRDGSLSLRVVATLTGRARDSAKVHFPEPRGRFDCLNLTATLTISYTCGAEPQMTFHYVPSLCWQRSSYPLPMLTSFQQRRCSRVATPIALSVWHAFLPHGRSRTISSARFLFPQRRRANDSDEEPTSATTGGLGPSAAARSGYGLATEQIGPDKDQRHPTFEQPGEPAGMIEILRHDSRVYSIWVGPAGSLPALAAGRRPAAVYFLDFSFRAVYFSLLRADRFICLVSFSVSFRAPRVRRCDTRSRNCLFAALAVKVRTRAVRW